MTTWLITGASRGFGAALTRAALDAGNDVAGTARDVADLTQFAGYGDAFLAISLDVTDQAAADRAVADALAAFETIDVLVNNAGYGLFGSVEETSDADFRAVFDTNVFGLLNVTRAALPAMRAQRSGRIFTMSSSAGFAVSAGRGPYGASKFAVEAITEALHDELAPLGIQVTAIEPGSFRTEFLSTRSRRATAPGIADYDGTVGTLLTAIAGNDGKQPGDPAKAVAAILRLATSDELPVRIQLGSDSVKLVETKLDTVRKDLDTWRDLSLSTDFSQ